MATVSCENRTTYAAASHTAAWVKAFYPDVTITLHHERIGLASTDRSAAGLLLIWRSALANEALLARAAGGRADVIKALVR